MRYYLAGLIAVLIVGSCAIHAADAQTAFGTASAGPAFNGHISAPSTAPNWCPFFQTTCNAEITMIARSLKSRSAISA